MHAKSMKSGVTCLKMSSSTEHAVARQGLSMIPESPMHMREPCVCRYWHEQQEVSLMQNRSVNAGMHTDVTIIAASGKWHQH